MKFNKYDQKLFGMTEPIGTKRLKSTNKKKTEKPAKKSDKK